MISMHLGRGGRGRASLRMLAAAAVLAATAATAAAAPAAHAGTYPMYAGDVPGINLPAPSQGAWTFWNTSGGIQAYNELATRTQGASALWQINYPTGVLVQGTGVGLELTIPSTGAKSAVSIASVTDWTETALSPQHVSGPAGPPGGTEAPAVGLNLAPGISNAPGGTASGWNGFTTSGPGHDSGPLPVGTKTRQLGVRCAALGADHNHCTLPSPFLRIRGLRTMLKESAQPSGSITGGTLVGGGTLTGTKTIAYSAADDESGVEKVEALLDGVVVATGSNARDLTQPVAQQSGGCKYSALQACPAALDNVLPVDTNLVPDGAYELSIRITDAAANVQTVLAPDPVVIDNHPAPINTELPAIVGPAVQGAIVTAYDGIWRNAVGAAAYRWKRCSADLSSCAPIPDAVAASYRVQALDVGKRLQLEVTRVNDVGEPVAATTSATDVVVAAVDQTPVIINPPGPPGPTGPNGANGPAGANGANGTTVVLHLNGHNATASASLAATFSASSRGTLRSAYGKKVLITGRLVTPGGQPISGAKVQVLQQDKLVGARMAPAGEVTTDSAGKFRYVTTAVRSRTIRFAYRTHIEDATFASTTDISLGVIARLSLSATPRSLRNGKSVVFRGSVAGAPANARKVIELQVKKGSRWMTFRSTRLRSGRYSERYRFTRTRGRVTYVFRARVREEAGFPFLTSHSHSVKVTVRG